MKKFLLLIFLISTYTYLKAQAIGSSTVTTTTTQASPAVSFGLKAGANIANIETDLYENTKSRINLHGGLLAHIHLNNRLALQPEIVYSAQGFKQDISSGLEVEVKTDYINIPVLIQYMNSGFRVETGPQIGFLINAKAEYTDGRDDEDLKEYLKTTDFSWVFGLGYLSNAGLGISARYNLGITNINEKLTSIGDENTEMNHRVWQFGLFYQFSR